MSKIENSQSQEQHDEHATNRYELKSMTSWFIGMTIGNVIGNHLFDLEFSVASSVSRAAVATGVLYGGHKVWDKIKG